MGRLTTHILDTAQGHPGAGIRIELRRMENGNPRPIKEAVTNGDGRVDAPLLEGEALTAGDYELVFHVGDYFDGSGLGTESPRFLNEVVIRFGVARPDEHYHVPLLISPYGYTTYRGS
ncbi:hydroxyisourate hydrolase [Arhodomonas sp. SL1]|uniref:hydroxyisourate hydrolase n=1 Tax=Arhodomonas sp. SL1 TaxID=3425691 RepID=UPI003F884A9E